MLPRQYAFRKIIDALKIRQPISHCEFATREMIFQRPAWHRAVPVAWIASWPGRRGQVIRGQRAVLLYLFQYRIQIRRSAAQLAQRILFVHLI